MKNYEEYTEENYTHSVWVNPTKDVVTVKVWRGPELAKKPWVYLTVPPGEERPFPSEYDTAIHKIDRNGVIVGGKAPQLRKKGAPYKLHPALDTELSERTLAFEQAQRALHEKSLQEQAFVLAASKIKIAEDVRLASQRLEQELMQEKTSHIKKNSKDKDNE